MDRTPPAPALGDTARRAASLAKSVRLGPIYSKIFFLIGGFIDAGHPSPSWTELARRAKVQRMTVRNAVGECERRGILAVDRPGAPHPDRYEIRQYQKVKAPA